MRLSARRKADRGAASRREEVERSDLKRPDLKSPELKRPGRTGSEVGVSSGRQWGKWVASKTSAK